MDLQGLAVIATSVAIASAAPWQLAQRTAAGPRRVPTAGRRQLTSRSQVALGHSPAHQLGVSNCAPPALPAPGQWQQRRQRRQARRLLPRRPPLVPLTAWLPSIWTRAMLQCSLAATRRSPTVLLPARAMVCLPSPLPPRGGAAAHPSRPLRCGGLQGWRPAHCAWAVAPATAGCAEGWSAAMGRPAGARCGGPVAGSCSIGTSKALASSPPSRPPSSKCRPWRCWMRWRAAATMAASGLAMPMPCCRSRWRSRCRCACQKSCCHSWATPPSLRRRERRSSGWRDCSQGWLRPLWRVRASPCVSASLRARWLMPPPPACRGRRRREACPDALERPCALAQAAPAS